MTNIKAPGALTETDRKASEAKIVTLFSEHDVQVKYISARLGVSKTYVSKVLNEHGLLTRRFAGHLDLRE